MNNTNPPEKFIFFVILGISSFYIIGAIVTFILSYIYVPSVSFVSKEDRAMMHAIGWPIGLPLVIKKINES